jgi:hypothetical protein
MSPSDSRTKLLRFRVLIRISWWPAPPLCTGLQHWAMNLFDSMPTLLPREPVRDTSVVSTRTQRPSPFDHRVGNSNSLTRLLIGSFAFRPAALSFENSRPRVTATPLPRTTKVYGQLLGRDLNPLDSLLLLRTARSPPYKTTGGAAPPTSTTPWAASSTQAAQAMADLRLTRRATSCPSKYLTPKRSFNRRCPKS